ncbi:MAG: methionine--tRNA ligase [bacterium]
MKDTFYLTTPLYYVNDEPHIGHAYTTVLADVIARYHRLFNESVHLLTGTDEHGQKVAQAAEKIGRDPQQHCDLTTLRFKDVWVKLSISYDDFIRTTEQRHKDVVIELLEKLHKLGDIYEGEYEGWYSVFEERFFTEKDLVDGKDPIGGRPVEKLTERGWFFRMSKYQKWLIDWYENHPDAVLPSFRMNEVLGFLRQPLGDLNISRPSSRLSWGIPIPWDREFVTYVWFDALTNYYSATIHPAKGTSPKWPADFHLIGKDILTTHAVYWPIMLHAAGLEPPRHILAHGWWMGLDAEKMSKSRGNVVKPLDLADIYGPDEFRYYLMRDMVVGQDANFSEENVVKRLNSDLANDFGNLLNRVTKLIVQHFNGVIPHPEVEDEDPLVELAARTAFEVRNSIEKFAIHNAIEETLQFVRAINRDFTERQPWSVAKKDKERAGVDLARAAEGIRIAATLLSPVMPVKSAEVLQRLGIVTTNGFTWDDVAWTGAVTDKTASHGDAVFPRHDAPAGAKMPADTKVSAGSKESGGKSGSSEEHTPIQPDEDGMITFNDFKNVDLRTAKVLEAEPVEDTDKLMKLRVQIGDEERQLVAGIKQHYTAESLIGKTIIIVANLQPAKIKGVDSQGMLLAVREGDSLSLLTTDSGVASGNRIS